MKSLKRLFSRSPAGASKRTSPKFLPSRTYSFVRGRELEGTFPGPPNMGVWLATAQRVGKGWGHPPEAAWPYRPEEWPPTEPADIDVLAKARQTTAYFRCRGLADCRQALNRGGAVLAAFQVDASWLGSDGRIDDPRRHTPEATHSLLLFAADDVTEHFHFVNSWGENWGDGGFGYLPYRYWSDRLLEAWIPDDRAADSVQTPEQSGIVAIGRGATDPWGRQIHMVELEDRDGDEMVGWAILIEIEDTLEIEELFVRPAFREAGHGRILATAIQDVRANRGQPLKAWIPHADWPASSAQRAIFSRLQLEPRPSPERWAAACAVETSLRSKR